MRTFIVVSWHQADKITAWRVRGSVPGLFLLQMTLTGDRIRSKNDGCSLTGIKRPGRSVNHFPSSSVEVKRGWSYTSASPIRLHGTDSLHAQCKPTVSLFVSVWRKRKLRVSRIWTATLWAGVVLQSYIGCPNLRILKYLEISLSLCRQKFPGWQLRQFRPLPYVLPIYYSYINI